MSYLQEPKTLSNYGLGVAPDHEATCVVCRENPAQIFFNANPLIRTNQVFPCVECKKKQDNITIEPRRWYEQNARGVFQHKKTGEEVVLDQRGKKMDNPYKNRDFDKHGWLQTGNKKQYKEHLESQGKL